MIGICPKCGKEISTVRIVGWRWFALWLLLGVIPVLVSGLSFLMLWLGIIPVLIYVFYHFTKVPKSCPLCAYSNIYDEGRQLRKQLRKERIQSLKKRLLYLDRALVNTKKINQQAKEELLREPHEVAEELRKHGHRGTVVKLFRERKY